jgi:hypothetical protein
LIQGYATRATIIGEGEVDLTCLTDKYAYTMTQKGGTYVDLSVVEMGKSATLKLGFSLYSVRGKDTLTRDDITLVVNEQQLKTIFAAK